MKKCLVLVLMVAGLTGMAQAQSEFDVKAAFLANFTRFVTYPGSSASRPEFVVGVLGARAYESSIQRAFVDRKFGNKNIRVKVISGDEALSDLDVLFVGPEATSRLTTLVNALRGQPILVVADGPGLMERGAAISFVMENNKVRFEVNATAAKLAKLEISSRLLKLATKVVGI